MGKIYYIIIAVVFIYCTSSANAQTSDPITVYKTIKPNLNDSVMVLFNNKVEQGIVTEINKKKVSVQLAKNIEQVKQAHVFYSPQYIKNNYVEFVPKQVRFRTVDDQLAEVVIIRGTVIGISNSNLLLAYKYNSPDVQFEIKHFSEIVRRDLKPKKKAKTQTEN